MNILGTHSGISPAISELACVVLVATQSGRSSLLRRALASIQKQDAQPDLVVVVGDGIDARCDIDPEVDGFHCITNIESPGAANTWNFGIRFITEQHDDCYVAFLDDDDHWDRDHLSLCIATAKLNDWPDAILSGLRIIRNGEVIAREPIRSAPIRDFLAGNPGWQGSNTFIKLSTLKRAGGFTSGLASCNDRDLAIRVLSLDGVQVAFTGRHSANWHFDSSRNSLSSRNGAAKLLGLAHFYRLHRHRMSTEVEQIFFARAASLFGWSKEDIVMKAGEHPHV